MDLQKHLDSDLFKKGIIKGFSDAQFGAQTIDIQTKPNFFKQGYLYGRKSYDYFKNTLCLNVIITP